MIDRDAELKALDREVTLRDGARVRVRPIRPEDEAGLVSLYGRLSAHTAYQRFFSVMRRLPPDWAHFLANVDYRQRFALVAERPGGSSPALLAVARYEPSEDPAVVEIALVVQDDWQQRGLGTLLLGDLLRAAAANGIARFCAWVLADNRRMLDLLARLTDVTHRTIEQGVCRLELRTRAGPNPAPPPGYRRVAR